MPSGAQLASGVPDPGLPCPQALDTPQLGLQTVPALPAWPSPQLGVPSASGITRVFPGPPARPHAFSYKRPRHQIWGPRTGSGVIRPHTLNFIPSAKALSPNKAPGAGSRRGEDVVTALGSRGPSPRRPCQPGRPHPGRCVSGPGISSYTSNPEQAGESLRGCLEEALALIPRAQQPDTPMFLGATAGMRLLR